jgi:hypothetical protein
MGEQQDDRSMESAGRKISAAVKMPRRAVAVGFPDAIPAGMEKFAGPEPAGCSFWEAGRCGKILLYVAGKSFQLRGGCIHAQYSVVGGAGKRNRANAEDDVRSGLCETGRGTANSAAGENAGGDCVRATGRSGIRAGCGAVCVQTSGGDVLNEAAGRAGIGSGAPVLGRPMCVALPASLQAGSIPSSGLHGIGRGRNVFCGARQGFGGAGRGAKRDRGSKQHVATVC